MSLSTAVIQSVIALLHQRILKNKKNAIVTQQKIFQQLVQTGKKTLIGKDLHFQDINTQKEFQQAVPITDYENLKPYIHKIQQGEQNVLWKGQPLYFAKTSGTTSGIKYIPITAASIHNHINTARNALISYAHEKKTTKAFEGKMIFLSGSPILDSSTKILTGRLSGIVNHHVPAYIKTKQLPTYQTNCIADWEEKLDHIVSETMDADMRLISGIPPWVQMYFEQLLARTKKKNIKEIFPHLELFVHGGVNFQPYKKNLEQYIGTAIDTIETYPASEGFIAYQDSLEETGLLLNTNSGILFEFVLAVDIHEKNPRRFFLPEVELNKNYVVIISSNAGLWGYNIGDTIKFVSLNPYKIIVTGRIKHFISAFGEHVIAEEVEYAMQHTMQKFNFSIKDFTVAPHFTQNGKAYHEWFIAFENNCEVDLSAIAKDLNEQLCKKNIYYKDLIQGNVLNSLHITRVEENAFILYMKSIGKLGEQNKVPRLSNDRIIADALRPYCYPI